jgi:amino acid adenylation domain-containing protein
MKPRQRAEASGMSERGTNLPLEQEAIRAKCFHPTGAFEEFPKEEIEQSIPERFEKIVARFPDHIAVKSKNQTLTYGHLNKAANRLAHAVLAWRGVSQEPVALFFERGLSLIIANMAVLKAKKFALLVAPSAPRDRIAHILNDSQASLVLTDTKNICLAQEWANSKTKLINLDELNSKFTDENLLLSIPPDTYAQIGYTSGSTGRAKGAVKTHRQVLYASLNFTNLCHICAEDRVAVFGFSAIGKHLFDTLLNGATQYPLDLQAHGLLHLAEWLNQEEITIFITLPTAFRHLVNSRTDDTSYPKLRLIRLGGEPVRKRDVDLYKRYFSSECLLANMYATKESGAICLFFIDKNSDVTESVPVGYPVAGMEVSVVDDLANKAENNQPGEIVVKSRFLSSGYWRRNDLTREKFHSAPDGGDERTYFTGDIGRLSDDGCLEHLGRKDSIVKIRNFRVDLGEVEATLTNHPAVKGAIVTAKEIPTGDTTLIAYLVLHGKQATTVTSLRRFLNEQLPEYMVPSAFVTLEKFPLTSTGKVDRRALPDPGKERPKLETPFVEPRTMIERELVSIWAEILSLREIGIHDNFFDLGGHSLAATRVVSKVIKKFQLELPLQSLFLSPTIAEMTAVITEHQGKQLGDEEMERMLGELESLSDEEAQRLLGKGTTARSNGERHE